MQKSILFRSKKTLDLGFSTLEVLVSILVALAFVSFSMQAFVLGMGMKLQAQEKQRANQLIQEDLELLNKLASNIPATTAPQTIVETCSAFNNGTTVSAYNFGYAKDLWDALQTEKPNGDPLLSTTLLGDGIGETVSLTRDPVSDGSSVAPHRTLKINYQVTDSNDDVIAERYVEVIPDVALRCP